jgi:transposase-like protein
MISLTHTFEPSSNLEAATERPGAPGIEASDLLRDMQDYKERMDRWIRRFSHVRVQALLLDFAPEEERCPRCGGMAHRHQVVERGPVIDADLEGPRLLMIELGVYACRSKQCRLLVVGRRGRRKWKPRFFRKQLPFTVPRGRYTLRARQLGIDAVKIDGMPFAKVVERLAREFHMSPARSTAWRWHKEHGDKAAQAIDLRRWTKMSLSGVVCLDEMYDGEFCLLVASDPLTGLTVGYQVHESKKVDSAQVAEFMRYLSHRGIDPQVVITDESTLYPAALKEAWPGATHQLCLFHILRHFVRYALASVREYVKSMPKDAKRRRGRPKKRGRPRSNHNARRKELYDARHLFVYHPDNLEKKPETKQKLESLLQEHPALAVPRKFMEDLFRLFAPGVTRGKAEALRQEMLSNPLYRNDPHLKKGLKKLLSDDQFQKMIVYTDYDNLGRTNNDVERKNRWIRKKQKSHYRLRRTQTLTNALALQMQREQEGRRDSAAKKLRARTSEDENLQAKAS